jgi:hypothetical protein
MTAVVIVAQPRHGLIHFAGDAAMYQNDQTVTDFGCKAFPIAHWPGLVTSAGNSAMVPLFGWSLSQEFASFDAAVESAEQRLPVYAERYGLPNGGQFFLVGISSRGPEAYVCRTDDALPPGVTVAQAEASGYWADARYKLIRLPNVGMSPVPNDQVLAANYEGIDPDDDPETVVWGIRKMLEMQRQTKLPDGIGGIGGFAQLTTISGAGITQRILQRWSADRTGALLKPAPIVWAHWHRDNPKPVQKPNAGYLK